MHVGETVGGTYVQHLRAIRLTRHVDVRAFIPGVEVSACCVFCGERALGGHGHGAKDVCSEIVQDVALLYHLLPEWMVGQVEVHEARVGADGEETGAFFFVLG